ncbi:MAG: hypothetical protein L6R19_13820 [Alphaproteobacteria bacterium]|nr:hypothetical protein [Alphaproteobacteria bacterium]
MMQKLRWILLILAVVPLAATTAHVVELPNKLLMDGPLWLAVQQRLYRGWGPAIAPFEIGAIALAWVLVWRSRGQVPSFGLSLIAAVLFSLCLAVFFGMNRPVNLAFARWTAATLPADWQAWRLQWELGHALSFVLWLMGFCALVRTMVLDRVARSIPPGPRRRTLG